MSLNAYLAIAAVVAVILSPVILLTSPLWITWIVRERREAERLGLQALWPSAFRTLSCYAETMIGGELPAGGWGAVARRIDGYVARLRFTRQWRIWLVIALMELAPLLTLRPRFSKMHAGERRAFARARLQSTRGIFGLASLGRQLVRLGYYSDEQRQSKLGFVPFRGRGPAPRRSLEAVW